MGKKYELTDEVIKVNVRTLHRIKALKDFGYVEKGDLGGYIESELNLSQKGDCWIGDNAKVYGDAHVYGTAKVYENAYVHESTEINYGEIIGDISLPYKNLFQFQCKKKNVNCNIK